MCAVYSPPRAWKGASVWGFLAGLIALVFLAPLAARADVGPTLIVEMFGKDPVTLTMADLQAMPVSGFSTSTVWTEQVDAYEGVLLRDLLVHYGVEMGGWTGSITLTALDGYTATISHELITPESPLLAYHRNGAAMPVRSQGPFWLIFPYDSSANYRTESTYAMSVWQIRTLRIAE